MKTGKRVTLVLVIIGAVLVLVGGVICGVSYLVNNASVREFTQEVRNEYGHSGSQNSDAAQTQNADAALPADAQITSLSLNVGEAKVGIAAGDKVSLSYTGFAQNGLAWTLDDGELTITQKDRDGDPSFSWGSLFSGFHLGDADKRVITLILPADALTSLDISAGACDLEVKGLTVGELAFRLGAGQAELRDLTVTGDAELTVGAGSLHCTGCSFNEADFIVSAGRIDCAGALTGDCSVKCGVGSADFALTGAASRYACDYAVGVGSLTFTGRPCRGSGSIEAEGEPLASLDIKVGVGSVAVTAA